MPRAKKKEVISFKVDEALSRALAGIPNRSEFIRSAIHTSLEIGCPLCQGMGILSPEQKKHWDSFSRNHAVEKCRDCHAIYLTCAAEEGKK